MFGFIAFPSTNLTEGNRPCSPTPAFGTCSSFRFTQVVSQDQPHWHPPQRQHDHISSAQVQTMRLDPPSQSRRIFALRRSYGAVSITLPAQHSDKSLTDVPTGCNNLLNDLLRACCINVSNDNVRSKCQCISPQHAGHYRAGLPVFAEQQSSLAPDPRRRTYDMCPSIDLITSTQRTQHTGNQ